jgi:aerobic carbon-monoxide dehydrogenase medium subunit
VDAAAAARGTGARVKPPPFVYHAPTSVAETVALLGELGDDGKVLAGGQSLVPMMNLRLAQPAALVDLAHVAGLDTIGVTDDRVRVEARVTHERLRRHDGVAAAAPLLRQALDWVAHPVIRNRGTSLGSIVHADPAAELPAVLGLLDGEVELAAATGTRTVAGGAFVTGPLESDLRPGELAIAFSVPAVAPRTGTAFTELARRHGDYALAGVGACMTLDDDRRVTAARAAVIAVAGTPVHLDLTEALVGQPHDALLPADAIGQARATIDPMDDIHATAAYRRHLAGVLLGRALEAAAHRAAGEEER